MMNRPFLLAALLVAGLLSVNTLTTPAFAVEFKTDPQTLEMTPVEGSVAGGAANSVTGAATGAVTGAVSQNVQDAIAQEQALITQGLTSALPNSLGLGSLGGVGGVGGLGGSAQPTPGTAAGITCAICQCQADLSIYHRLTRRDINRHIDKSFDKLRRNYLLGEFIDNVVRPEIQKKTQQNNASDQQETAATASIEDAVIANEKAQEAAEEQVEEARESVTSPLIGTLATFARGLSKTTLRLHETKVSSGDLNMEKVLARSGTLANKGAGALEKWRTDQMLKIYVDDAQQGGLLKGAAKGSDRADRDVDISRSLLGRTTLDVNFADNTLTEDEEDLLALKENLMPSSTFSLSTMRDLTSPEAQQRDLPELLTSAARKSIIESSMNTIIGQRSLGSDVSKDQMQALLVDRLGYDADSPLVKEMTGEASYEGHMEALTRYAFQDPNVYIDLIGQPEMIQRAIVAQSAIRNMQQYDIYASMERAENLTALWAWMATRPMHTQVQNELSNGAAR